MTDGLAEFNERATAYFRAATDAARAWYGPDGSWLRADLCPPLPRERFWLCFSLYAAGEAAWADAIIRIAETRDIFESKGSGSSFNIFHSNIAIALLVQHRDKMSPEIRAELEVLTRESFDLMHGNRQADYQFHGFNDNMPAKSTMGLILGGELLGDDAAVEHGLWNLRQFRAMLTRRGTNSEYNSPTYSPLTIHAMGEIAAHARNAEAREIALKCEERLWIDAAARFHPEMGVAAGPYSRAYTADTLAHFTCLTSLLWFVLGDIARPSPMGLFHPELDYVLHHGGDYAFNVSQMSWFAAGSYHLPERAAALFVAKRYPFCAVATAEQGSATETPACPVRIETFLQPDFTVGTASLPWLSGNHSQPYFVTYKRAKNIGSFRDIGTVYNKLVANDAEPGFVPPSEYAHSGEQDAFYSCANVMTLQADATVLLLSHPYLTLGENGPGDTPRSLSRLSDLIIFPSHFGGADEIRVGDAKRDSWSGEARPGEWIGCRRGRLLVAFRPLTYSREFGHAAITLEKINKYEVIRSTLFHGEPWTFTRTQLGETLGGFVAEHASVEDYPSLAAFLEALSHSAVTDFVWTTRRVRYQRGDLDLEMSWTPGSPVARFATINGLPVDDARVKIDGLTDSDLPFLANKPEPARGNFPWEDLRIGPNSYRGIIGSRDDFMGAN